MARLLWMSSEGQKDSDGEKKRLGPRVKKYSAENEKMEEAQKRLGEPCARKRAWNQKLW